MATYVCKPEKPHESESTPGEVHYDHGHYKVYENGVEVRMGRCNDPGNNHVTEKSLVELAWEYLKR